EGTAETIAGGIVVEGVVGSAWEGECRRCLGAAKGTIQAKVREGFESNAVEGETYKLEHDHIDIEPLVREAVMLELPIAPLCRENCKGLCPNCGTNWNEANCDCDREAKDPRWSALDVLKEAGSADE